MTVVAQRRGEAGWRDARTWVPAWPLGVLALAVALLAGLGVLPTWPGLPHLVALPPVDLFTDLRILMLEAGSWPAFVGVLVGVLLVRAVVVSHLLGGVTWRRVRFVLLCYLLVLLPVWLAAFVDAVAFAVLYSRLFWPGVGLLALVVVLLGAVPWQGTARVRTALRRAVAGGLRVEVVVPYAAVLVGIGVLGDLVPVLVLPMVLVSALATAVAARVMTTRPPMRHPGRGFLGFLLAFLLVAAVFMVTRPADDFPEGGPPHEGSLLIMSGINSSSGRGAIFESDPVRLGFTCEQTFYFSYAGPGDGQPRGVATCPITTGAPYEPADTQRPFAEQVEAFAAQTADLPRPLHVAAHSHAVWVAWEAIASGAADADVLLMVGPFPDSVIGYPPPDEDGPGRVFGDLLRWATPVADLVDFNFDPDAPAARELLATANASQEILGTPLPEHVRALSLTSATDLPLMPSGWRLDVERNACPARIAHPYLPISPPFYEEVIRFLAEEPAPDCPVWRDWGGVAARPFGVPPEVPDFG